MYFLIQRCDQFYINKFKIFQIILIFQIATLISKFLSTDWHFICFRKHFRKTWCIYMCCLLGSVCENKWVSWLIILQIWFCLCLWANCTGHFYLLHCLFQPVILPTQATKICQYFQYTLTLEIMTSTISWIK